MYDSPNVFQKMEKMVKIYFVTQGCSRHFSAVSLSEGFNLSNFSMQLMASGEIFLNSGWRKKNNDLHFWKKYFSIKVSECRKTLGPY
jgi:hypothetical protein